MRVLQINAVNGIRSTGRTTTELANYLNGNGHEAYVAYSDGSPYSKGFKIGNKIDRKFHGILSRISGKQGYFSKHSTIKLIKWMEIIKPDIVHLRNLHGNFINLPILFDYLARNDISTVITLHDCWFYSGGHTHYFKDGFYDWRDGFSKQNRNKNKMGNPSWFFDKSEILFRDQIKWFTNIPRVAFVGVSKWITNEAKQSIVTSGSIVQTIYNWIDFDTFHPVDNPSIKQRLNIEDIFLILGVASGWSNKKGLNKFIDLSYNLKDDECILLIGNIDKNIKLPQNIINVPETHDVNELANYYSSADVFINMSSEESFGKVSAEALACGTPIITNSSTANPELVGEGCGYIAENLDDVIKSISEIKFNSKSLYSVHCIKFAKENFSKNDRIRDYETIYKLLLGSDVG